MKVGLLPQCRNQLYFRLVPLGDIPDLSVVEF